MSEEEYLERLWAAMPWPVNVAVHEIAAEIPDRPAVVTPAGTLTYGQLVARADTVRAELTKLGLGPEDRVGLCVPRSAALAVGALAVLDAGAAYVAMDPGYPRDRLRTMLADSGAKALIAGAEFADLWENQEADSPAAAPPVVDPDQLPEAESAQPAPAPGRDDHLAYVVYTSGSTGSPRGVAVEHRGLRRLAAWHRRTFGLAAGTRTALLASPGFDASVWELWPALASGAQIHVPDDRVRTTPEALRDWLAAEQIVVAFLPTVLAEAVLPLPWPAGTALRRMLTGGDTLHVRAPADTPFLLVNNYGLTEAVVVSTSGPVERQRPDTAAGAAGAARTAGTADDPGTLPSIGFPLPGVDFHILDPELTPCPAGREGEVYIGGALLARGYLGDPAHTAERFVPDHLGATPGARLLRTGDRARLRADGSVEFRGRGDTQVKIRGVRVELDEISAVLARHPAVRAAAVTLTAGPGEPRLVAYVVPDAPDDPPPSAELAEFLAARLTADMVPATYVELPELPQTPNGKVDRAALPEPPDPAVSAAATASAASVADGPAAQEPRTEIEAVLGPIVAGLLELPTVGVDANFFRLGGHSLLGAQLLMSIADRFGVELGLRFLFDNPTVAAMAAGIEAALLAELDAMSEQDAQREVELRAGRAPGQGWAS